MTHTETTYRDELKKLGIDAFYARGVPVRSHNAMTDATTAAAARVLRDVRDSFAARPELGDETGQVLAASIAAAIDTWAAGKGLDLTETDR